MGLVVLRASAMCLLLACNGGGSEAKAKEHAAPAPTPAVKVEEALSNIVATCAEVNGPVEVRRKGQPQWEPATVGTPLRERDWVRTAAGGFARVRFSDRGFLDLPEHTTILVDSAISVESGSLVAVAEGGEPIRVKAADGSEARIVAAGGDVPAQIRLTAQTGGLEIAVTKGNVNVITEAGEQAVAAGEASDLSNHRAGAVVKLLGFPRSVSPGIDARFRYVADKKIAMTWKPVRGAAKYRLQVSRDADFRALVLDTTAAATSGAFVPDGVSEYVWRVAGIDADGRLGEFGFARRMYVEDDEPRELLIAPANGAKIGFADKVPRVTFSWRSAGDTKRYKLVIGHGSDLSSTVASIPTTGQELDVKTLREGTYHWGVYAIKGDRETPIFLAPRELTIRKQRVKAHTEKLWQEPR
jgi:hypothetical protein